MIAWLVVFTSLYLVAIPAKPANNALFLGDINTSDVSPPSTQASCRADLKSASTNVPSVPSVGAATIPAAKPGVVPVELPVGTTLFLIHDSTPAVVRAVPAPPALRCLVTHNSKLHVAF